MSLQNFIIFGTYKPKLRKTTDEKVLTL